MYLCIYVVSIFCFTAYLIFTHLANLYDCSIQPCLSFQIPMVYMLSFCIWCICVSLCRADRTVHLVQWRKRRLTPPTLPMSSSMQTAPDNIFVTQMQIQIQTQTQINMQIHTPDTGNVKFNAYCNSSSIQLKIVYTNTNTNMNTQSHLVLEYPPLTLANSSSMQLSPPYSLTTCLSTCRPISHCNEIHQFLAISARRDGFLHKKVASEEGWLDIGQDVLL